jgi:CheY-like chemotaxis protein
MSPILLIEDDAFKAKRISTFVSGRFKDTTVFVERSVSSGLSYIIASKPTILLLDMSLSTYDVGPREAGGRPQNFGGLTVLEHLIRRRISIPTIVITQFPGFKRDDGAEVSLDALRSELASKFPSLFKALLWYSSSDRKWEVELEHWINDILSHEEDK